MIFLRTLDPAGALSSTTQKRFVEECLIQQKLYGNHYE